MGAIHSRDTGEVAAPGGRDWSVHGSPTALGEALPRLPADFQLSILVVQHMPPLFTRLLAEGLNSTCQLPACEAYQGCAVEPGKILITPGDFHVKLAKADASVSVFLDQSPRQNSCRPAVDALFSAREGLQPP